MKKFTPVICATFLAISGCASNNRLVVKHPNLLNATSHSRMAINHLKKAIADNPSNAFGGHTERAIHLLEQAHKEMLQGDKHIISHKPATLKYKSFSNATTYQPRNCFAMFDNSYYRNVRLGEYGFIRSSVVYNTPWIRRTTDAGDLPNETRYKAQVKSVSANSTGPVVLDFENLYLRGTPEEAQTHLQLLKQLIQWAREVIPNRPIGFYGVLNFLDPQYMDLAKELANYEDAFFPTLYTRDADASHWNAKLAKALSLAQQVDPSKPVYLYLWPQYHDGPYPLQFISPDFWQYQLETAFNNHVAGVVVWSPNVESTDLEWSNATDDFTSNHVNHLCK